MRSLLLLPLLLPVAMTPFFFGSAEPSDILIADRDMSPVQLRMIGEWLGQASPADAGGFVAVRVRREFDTIESELKRMGVDFVFRASASGVDTRSIKSVETHIAYLIARKSIQGEAKPSVGFYEAHREWLDRRVEPNGELDVHRWLDGAKHREKMPKWTPGGKRNCGPSGAWQHLGPFGLDTPYRTYYGVPPLSGRKNAAVYAPSNPSIIYTTGGGGGVFRSADGGVTWAHKSDSWPFLQANGLAVHPTDPNIVLAGTGDYFQASYAYGLMRSTDGGNTWTNIPSSFGVGVITRIMYDPADPNHVIATVARSSRGVYRSTDGGLTWARVLDIGSSFQDLDISANNGGRTWWAVGGPNTTGGRIYKSNDGLNWTQVTSPSPSNETAVEVACSKVNRDTVYFLATGAEQIYKTTNAGTNWASVKNNFPNGNGNYNWSQKTYDYFIGCSTNGTDDFVFVGLITVAASNNGGASWADIGLTYTNQAKWHNDQHWISNHPTDPARMLVGGDGGLADMTYNGAANSATFTMLNEGISDEMGYEIDVHPTDPTRLMMGTQDNATNASRGNLADWDNLYAGDGCWCAFDKVNPQVHYTTAQYAGVFRYDTDSDASPTDISPAVSGSNFITPLIVAGNGSEMFIATNALHKYTVGGGWTLGTNPIGQQVICLAAAPSNGSVIYTGAPTGELWRTPDEGTNWTQVDGNLPGPSINAITVSRTNPNDVFAAVGNAGALYRCTDVTQAAPTWTLISGGGGSALPAVPVNCIETDPHFPNTIYVGTDLGCFYSINAGASWVNMTTAGLPNVMVTDLEINTANTYLYAGTYGRGMWRVAIEQPSFSVSGRITQNAAGVSGVVVNIKQGANLITTATTNGNGDYSAGSLFNGTYTIQPTHNDKVFFPATRDVTIPPNSINQNFTAGNIGPVSVTFQYPIVYSDQSRQGTIGLNTTTPVNRTVNLSDNSFKLNTPLTMTVPAASQNANFFVYGVPVTVDTPVTVTATAQGLTATGNITVRQKPALISMTLNSATIKGGIGVPGNCVIDKPAVGIMALYLSSNNVPVAQIFPQNTSMPNGVSQKNFYIRTNPVASNTLVTFTSTFYGSTRTAQLTVTP